MKLLMNPRFDAAVLGIIALLIFLLWGSGLDVSGKNPESIRSFGGDLPKKARYVLEDMNEEIRNTFEIVSAYPHQLVFKKYQKKTGKYSYNHGSIWKNDSPLLTGISAFHFEYRDRWGNLITRTDKSISSIETVNYTIRIKVDGDDVLAGSRVQIQNFHTEANRIK